MREKQVNSKMVKKILGILFSISIFLSGALLCIKPICSSTINQILIKDEFKSYIMDAVYEKYPEMSENQLSTIAEVVDNNPGLEKLASECLDATMESLESLESFEVPAAEVILDKMYQELAFAAEKQVKNGMSETERSEFIRYFNMNEYQVLAILYKIPFYLDYFNSYIPAALELYGLLTSRALLIIIVLIAGISGVGLIYVQKQNWHWLRNFGITAIVDAVILGVCVPLFINAVSPVLADRLLGMAFEMKLTSLYLLGMIFLATGVLLLLIRYFLLKYAPHGHVAMVRLANNHKG